MTRRLFLSLVLVDLPVLIAAAALGCVYGFAHTYETVSSWRFAHPWSFAPTVLLAVVIVGRRRREA